MSVITRNHGNDRIEGILLGVICGDMLGEPHEGQATPGLVTHFKVTQPIYTDDTEQTLITLYHLMSNHTIRPITMALELACNLSSHRKYGGNAFKTLKKIKAHRVTAPEVEQALSINPVLIYEQAYE